MKLKKKISDLLLASKASATEINSYTFFHVTVGY